MPDGARPPPQVIDEASVERALHWLIEHAATIGHAKARTIKAGHMLKHIEALEFKMSEGKSAEARKADARTSQRYIDAINEDAAAAGAYEELKALRETAALRIEAWRSMNANHRKLSI